VALAQAEGGVICQSKPGCQAKSSRRSQPRPRDAEKPSGKTETVPGDAEMLL
jgi:hypothetical protein